MLNKLMMDDGLPGEETFLINTNYRPSRTFNVTIPDGVKVVKAYIKNEYADSTGDGNIGTSSLWNNSSKKHGLMARVMEAAQYMSGCQQTKLILYIFIV